MSIDIENLCYTYNHDVPFEVSALKNVSLKISDGEFVCIIGHTGSGKSTLVQHFNGLLKAQSGKIVVEGIDLTVKKPDLRALRQRVGLVFQYPEYQLFEQTVGADIAFGPKNLGLSADETEERVCESMELVGLDIKLKNESPFELSGGQKRRVAIAGVLSMRPRVLVLDEPVAGLDPQGKDEILSLILNYKEKMGATIVMISHNMDDIVRVADRVIVMSNGEKALDGGVVDVFSQHERLLELGLGLPQVCMLVHQLNLQNKSVPTNICTDRELVDYIVGRVKQ